MWWATQIPFVCIVVGYGWCLRLEKSCTIIKPICIVHWKNLLFICIQPLNKHLLYLATKHALVYGDSQYSGTLTYVFNSFHDRARSSNYSYAKSIFPLKLLECGCYGVHCGINCCNYQWAICCWLITRILDLKWKQKMGRETARISLVGTLISQSTTELFTSDQSNFLLQWIRYILQYNLHVPFTVGKFLHLSVEQDHWLCSLLAAFSCDNFNQSFNLLHSWILFLCLVSCEHHQNSSNNLFTSEDDCLSSFLVLTVLIFSFGN